MAKNKGISNMNTALKLKKTGYIYPTTRICKQFKYCI